MAYSTMRSAIPLGSVSGGTFTAKLQNACTSTQYPEGTVFDCSGFTSVSVPSQFITGTITITRPGITLLFSEGDFIWNPTGGTALDANMFEIIAPNVTIIGVSRSAKDSVSTNGATRFVMNSPSTGYHVYTRPNLTTYASADSLTIMNCDFVGVKSIYTSSGGTVNYSTTGAGGILLTEGNVDQPNSNLNNVMISEVLVSGAKQHGVMIYGGMASKLQNVRVRNAGGHGFYIAGSTTSTTLDACYASGNHLAGFCINDTTYSTLTSCASDSNGLGYWMRNANSVTLNSCGAEACEVRSSIPNNLGIAVKNSAGTVLINDIGSDNVNFIKGTSFLFTGGENITGTSCYSKDPGNRAGLSTFLSKYTAHIHGVDGTTKVNMDNFKAAGTSTTKYLYRLQDVNNFHIDDLVTQYDPTNPTESPDGSMTFVNPILDQGANNIFGDFATSTSWLGRRVDVKDPQENLRVNQLYVPGRLSIPVEPAHPANPEPGSIYFNNTLNKLFMFSGSAWFDTCCATAPTPAPECVFPQGGITVTVQSSEFEIGTSLKSYYRIGNKIYLYSNITSVTYPGTPFLNVFDLDSETLETLLTNNDVAFLQGVYGNGGFTSSDNAVYSESTNSFYFTVGTFGPNSDNVILNSTQAIFKYSLDTNQIDASYILENLNETQAADAYNHVGRFTTLAITNNQLYVIGASSENYDQGNHMVHTTYDLDDLSLIDYLTGTTAGIFNVETPQNQKINEIVLTFGDRILLNRRFIDSTTGHSLLLYNLVTGDLQDFVYDVTAVPDNIPYCVSITNSLSGNTFFVADAFIEKVYELEYETFSIVNTFELGRAASIAEREINGKRIFFYSRAIYNALSDQTLTYYAATNITDNAFMGQIGTSGTEPGTGPGNQYNGSYFPVVDGSPNDYMYIITRASKIRQMCAPYTV